MRQRQRDDMVLLAHIREQHRLSLQSYSRPRITALGRKIGHRSIARLMRENDIKIVRTQKYKATTDSNHTFNTEKDSKIKNTFRNKNQRGGFSG